jgi:hypothetical protein
VPQSPTPTEFVLASLIGIAVACTAEQDNPTSTTTTDRPTSAEVEPSTPVPTPAATPTPEPRLDAIAIAQGDRFACALERAGTIVCWGLNDRGQLGQQHSAPVESSVRVEGIERAVTIAATGSTACAAVQDGEVLCWGAIPVDRSTKGKLAILDVRETTVLAAGHQRYCAITSKSTWCWDTTARPHGQFVGYGSGPSQDWGAQRVVFDDVRGLDVGWRSFAYLADGSAKGWNHRGDIEEVSDVVEALSDRDEECLVRSSGAVECWGNPIETMQGARSLVWIADADQVAGIDPVGELVVADRSAPPPSFAEAGELVALTSNSQPDIVGLHRDGRVFQWQPEDGSHHVPVEIGLPGKDLPGDDPPVVVVVAPGSQASADAPTLSAPAAKRAAALCDKGWALFNAGNVEEAEHLILDAVDLLEDARDPKGIERFGSCLYRLGRILEQGGDVDRARKFYQDSLDVRPSKFVQARLDALR